MPGPFSSDVRIFAVTLSALLAAGEAAAQARKPPLPPRPPVTASTTTRETTNGPTTLRQLQIANKPWTGDFDKLLQRRMLRVFAPFSRSLYFSDKGRERGLAVELVRYWDDTEHQVRERARQPAVDDLRDAGDPGWPRKSTSATGR